MLLGVEYLVSVRILENFRSWMLEFLISVRNLEEISGDCHYRSFQCSCGEYQSFGTSVLSSKRRELDRFFSLFCIFFFFFILY